MNLLSQGAVRWSLSLVWWGIMRSPTAKCLIQNNNDKDVGVGGQDKASPPITTIQ